MDMTVFDTELRAILNIDVFASVYWSEKFRDCGDCSIEIPFKVELLDYLRKDNYLRISECEKPMVIETVEFDYNSNGSQVVNVSGRTLESILDRRCIFPVTTIDGDVNAGISFLLSDSFWARYGSSAFPKRHVDNFRYSYGSLSSRNLVQAHQFTGDVLLDAVKSLCEENKIGFKMYIEAYDLVFELYEGTDRTVEQLKTPPIIFATSMENVDNIKYLTSNKELKNTAIIAGEGEGILRRYTWIEQNESSGLTRRELFVDARDIQSESQNEAGETVQIPEGSYLQLLSARGWEKLKEVEVEDVFECSVIDGVQYTYGKDYFLGDTVTLFTDYGVNARGVVTEFAFSEDTGGKKKTVTVEVKSTDIIYPAGDPVLKYD